MGGCVSSKQTKKDTPDVPNPSKVPTLEEALEEALEKLGRNEEKLCSEIEDIEMKLKEEQSETRKESLRAKLTRKDSVLKRVQSKMENMERIASAQTMKLNQLCKKVSMDATEEVDKAMNINNRVRTLTRVEESRV